MAYHFTLKTVQYKIPEVMDHLGLTEKGRVQQFIDSEVLRLCDPMVPKDTGALINSGLMNTEIGSGEVIYRTPYARRWYYMPAEFQDAPMRGNYWFERMKNEGGKEKILRGAAKIAKKGGSE